MKGPGIKEYLNIIEKKKEEAIKNNLDYIDILSKDLHSEVSPNFATMPTCCQAMYKLMLQGDEILRLPKGNTGFGSYLHLRYYLNDLSRERLYKEKKRGRPRKSDEEKLEARRSKMKKNTEELAHSIKIWLDDNNYKYEDEKDIIIASNEMDKWIINVNGVKRGRKQSLPSRIVDVIKKMNDCDAKYSIAFNDTTSYRKAWKEIPDQVKSSLKMSVILADKNGKIIEI